jgi:hypothetical protein
LTIVIIISEYNRQFYVKFATGVQRLDLRLEV